MVCAWICTVILIITIVVGLFVFFDTSSTTENDSKIFYLVWSVGWVVGTPLISWIATGDAWFVLKALFDFLWGGAL